MLAKNPDKRVDDTPDPALQSAVSNDERQVILASMTSLDPIVRQRALEQFDERGELHGKRFPDIDPITCGPRMDSSMDPGVFAAIKLAKAQLRRERRAAA